MLGMRARGLRCLSVASVAAAVLAGVAGCPGDSGGPVALAPPTESDIGPSYLRRLTRSQLDRTVRDLLGTSILPSATLPPDEVVGAFFSNITAPVTS